MTLHIINKSYSSSSAITSCLRTVEQHDAILFIEDGVYNAVDEPSADHLLSAYKNPISIFVLNDDVAARGLSDRLQANIDCISYEDFVSLTEQHKLSQSWY